MHKSSHKIKKNILLVALSFNDSFAPLGIANLKSYALKDKLIEENFNIFLESYAVSSFSEKSFFSLVKTLNPKIIGFTVWCWCKNRVILLSNKVKNRFPETTIIFGGLQVEENYLKNKNVDFLIHGRGELAFKEFLKWYLLGGNIEKVPSLSFRNDEKIITTKYASLNNLDEIPSPYLNGVIDLTRYPHPVLQVEYGCNIMNCYFCDIHPKEKIKRFFSLERVKKEILFILKRSNCIEIINCNLNLYHDRFVQILNIFKKSSHENSEIILWLNHNFFKPGDEKLINLIKGKKILEFELYVPKGEGMGAAKKTEIKKLSKVLSFLTDRNIVNCLSIMLDSFPKDPKKELLKLNNEIKKFINQDNFHLFTYPRMTGKNYYDKVSLK